MAMLANAGVGYNLLANTAYATGSDLFNFYCAGGQCLTVYDCATYCKNTARCAAFTYANGMCNLKSVATAQIAMSGAFAGLITQSNVNAPPYMGALHTLILPTLRVGNYLPFIKLSDASISHKSDFHKQRSQTASAASAVRDPSAFQVILNLMRSCCLQTHATRAVRQPSLLVKTQITLAITSKARQSQMPQQQTSANMPAT